jgi:diaminopimelate decarboxylase|tara:strand:+ start:115 stop:285 length:171 start_codon:yes stop_codon:yes gene_type:complete
MTVGDVIATPVTGAYGHSMGSNYNQILRPSVIFVKEGEAKEVVARETFADLVRRER